MLPGAARESFAAKIERSADAKRAPIAVDLDPPLPLPVANSETATRALCLLLQIRRYMRFKVRLPVYYFCNALTRQSAFAVK